MFSKNKLLQKTIFKCTLYFYLPFLCKKIKDTRINHESAVINAIACSLNISSENASAIYIKGIKSFVRFRLKFSQLARLPLSIIESEIDNVTVINSKILKDVQAMKRPIILVSIHTGDFYTGFLKLAKLSRTNQIINIVKVASGSTSETGVYNKIQTFCPNLNVLRFDQEIAKTCFLQLRKNNIVAIMNDIEVRVNKRVTVDFMGKKSHLQCGIAQLAVPTKAIILPMVNYKDSKGNNILKIESPIDATLAANEKVSSAIERVTQDLATYMEEWLINHPEQFQYWSDIAGTLYAKKDKKVNLDVKYK
ncbi:MAG: lauroyl/myristoyl acyltransferase [Alteromonadaceae bacterium]